MTWTKENMFEPSGCLTRESFEALVNHQLSAEAKALADEHIALCPFCSDALEGFSAQNEEFAVLMDKADESFAQVVAKAQTKSINRRILWVSIAAAASVIMIVGLFLLIHQPKQAMQLAQSAPEVKPPAKPVTESKTLNETDVEEKTPNTKTKANTEKKKVTPATTDINRSEEAPTLSAPKAEVQTNAPVVSSDAYKKDAPEEVVAENKGYVGEDKKEADKTAAAGMSRSKSMVTRPVVREVSADEAEMTLTKQVETPLAFAEQMPEYPGGTDAMLKFLISNMKFPATTAEMGISGRIMLQFVVGKTGKISNIKIVRGISEEFDKEAIRIVKLMPDWIPGKQNGKPVPVLFTMPINIHPKE